MTTDQAVSHYGTQVKLATALKMAQSTISGWGEYPPEIRQLQIQQLTGGKLKAEPGILVPKKKAA
jgi:transcriptional repressor of cell division inhibition gene dicB